MRSALLLLALLLSPQDDWKPARAPLMTRWARDVSPDKVLPEYPRPQMVRSEWRNLNGLWDYAITPKDGAAPKAYDGKILVPFAIESALSGVMKRVDEKSRLWYRREMEIPKAWVGKRVLLHFGAADWEATVFINGKEVGSHRGGYDGFSFDITGALREGRQEVVVSVFDATGGYQPRGKQARNPSGIFYTPTTGIWQTVWMEPVAESHIDRLTMVPDVDAGCLKLTVHAPGVVEAVAKLEGKEVGRVKGKGGESLALPVPNAALWSPDRPFLYDLEATLAKDGVVVDSVSSYFGMRKIALGKDENGITRPMLNGKFVFQTGPLDQGYWPDGILTAPTDEALRYDIEITKKLGFNATRKHVKVEPERWYFWCDKLGLLVWQDMPSGDATPPKGKQEIERSAESGRQFEQELKAMIDGRGHHPSIVLWVVYNEAWGQWETARMTAWVKEHDPSRLVDCASGWNDVPVGDVHDAHVYPGPGSPKPEAGRAAVLGEFGGLGLGVEGHTWSAKTWGYQGMSSGASLTRKYVSLLRKAWELKNDPGLSAAIYTQLADVETECNGLLTYDRAVIKVDVEKVAAANHGVFPPPPTVTVLAPTAQKEGVAWRYTLERPGDGWMKPEFDASAWKEGPAGFGTAGTPGAVVRTEWKTSDLWLRREFTLGDGALIDPQILMHHDDDGEVYVNGVLAAAATGYSTSYDEFDLRPEARATLKPGKVVLAVHCRQIAGGQYIDVGLVDVRP